MSQIRVGTRQNLDNFEINPQSYDSNQHLKQRIKFPQIRKQQNSTENKESKNQAGLSLKLNKNQLKKQYFSFINSKTCQVEQMQGHDFYSHQKQSNRKNNTQPYDQMKCSTKKIKQVGLQDKKLNQNKDNSSKQKNKQFKISWKLNLKHTQMYQNKNLKMIRDTKTLFTDPQEVSFKPLINSRNKHSYRQDSKRSLLQEIRDIALSPINYSSTDRSNTYKLKTNTQINQNINQSNKIISIIKKNRKLGFFDTESINKNNQTLQKLQQKLGLFSYLKRNFVTQKKPLTPQKIQQYFKSGSNSELQAKINYASRQFLQSKMYNDYKSYRQVQDLRYNLSEQAIKQQIQHKNQQFHKEYLKKYQVPYISFLSLPKSTKMKVLKSITSANKTIRTKNK